MAIPQGSPFFLPDCRDFPVSDVLCHHSCSLINILTMRILFIFLFCMTSLAVHAQPGSAGARYSDGHVDQQMARRLVAEGIILPLSQIIRKRPFAPGARILEIELILHQEIYVYQLWVLGNDGIVREYAVNAHNGRLLAFNVLE